MSSTQEAGNLFGPGPAHAMMRSPTVLIASVGLWGMNIFFFRVFGIDYVRVLQHDVLKIDGKIDDVEVVKKETDVPLTLEASDQSHRGTSQTQKLYAEEEEFLLDESSPLDQEKVDPPSAVTWYRLVSLSMTFLVLLHISYTTVLEFGGGPVGAVFSFYFTVACTIMLPLHSLQWVRKSTVIVVQRAFELLNPRCFCLTESLPRPVPFVDVFFADAMCSLSKVFFDWGILLHMATSSGTLQATAQTILIPSCLAAIPYLIRTRQCVLMYTLCRLKSDRKRFSHLWNALKYATSIFPLCLSAYSKTLGSPKREKELEVYLVILLAVNAFYALYWDIVMDWGMMQNPTSAASTMCAIPGTDSRPPMSCGHALLRNRLRFGFAISVVILVADAVLRFSWVLRFYSHALFPSDDSFVLCTQFLEVFRRAIWNLLRVEWENIKQTRPQATPQPEEMKAIGTPIGTQHRTDRQSVKKRAFNED